MLTNTGKDHEVRAPVHENPLVAGLIRQIAESDVFRAAPVMRKLLLYLWQNRAESISEYAIATEALGRAPDFDSRTDASVRVLIARLRAKLNEFYARAGDDFQLLLSIPVGGHQIEWSLKNDAVKEPVEPVAVPAVPVPDELAWRRPFVVAAAAAAILALVCIVLAISLVRLRNSPAPVPPLPRFWKAFMASGKPADIVIPDQTGFRWQDQGIYVIDPRTPDFEKWRDSPVLRGLADKWGPPSLNQTFIFGRYALAGFNIDQYLRQHGQEIQIVEGAAYAADLYGAHNTIFIGLPSSSPYIRRFSEKTNFRIVNNIPLIVENKHPAPSEPARYNETEFSEKRRSCPGILVFLPRKAAGARTMLLAGRFANAFSSMLLSAEGLKLIDDAWRRAGAPDGWEMVLMAEIENNTTVVKTTPVTVRAIGPDFWN